MSSYRIELFLHISAVAVGLGAAFAYPFLQAFAEKSGVASTRLALRFGQRLDTIVTLPGAIVVFVMGSLLIMNDEGGFKDKMPVWLSIAMTWFLVTAAVDFFVQRKNLKAGIAALEGVADSAPLPAAYMAISKRLQMVAGVIGLSVVGIMFLMVYQPGS